MGLFRRRKGDEVRLKVTGMHCDHCETSVRKALGRVPGVRDAEADRERGTAVVRVEGEVSHEALVAAVEDAGYQAEPTG